MKRTMGKLFTLVLLCILAGCSSSKTMYLPDGRLSYMTSCESKGWQRCYLRATKKCQPEKYEVLQRQHENKVLYYRCEKTPPSINPPAPKRPPGRP